MAEIGINLQEYEDAVKSIQKAQERSSNNNKNFKDDISTTTAGSVLSYKDVLLKLKDYMKEYTDLLQSDIINFHSIGKLMDEKDKELAAKMG